MKTQHIIKFEAAPGVFELVDVSTGSANVLKTAPTSNGCTKILVTKQTETGNFIKFWLISDPFPITFTGKEKETTVLGLQCWDYYGKEGEV